MTIVTVEETIAANANDVFKVLGDFGRIKVGGAITAFELEGEGVGAVRTITMGGGKVIERLNEYDSEKLIFGYSILNEDNPLPVSNYSSRVEITADGENACTVNWSGNFEPKGTDEAAASKVVRGIYTGGIAGTRETLGC
ncbi:SRPBCC family protein [Gammaproteobacteria bacterium]|nr:SRPBCC family protein [Gammaproteobacteria bacterium]